MQVLIIRHAHAVPPSGTSGGDDARPLSNEGRHDFETLAGWLAKRSAIPEIILHSPRRRAEQTAQLLAKAAGLTGQNCRREHWLQSNVHHDQLIGTLEEYRPGGVALVGHEPDMSRCTSHLVHGGQFWFAPGTIACIEFPGRTGAGQGQLKWLVTPSLVR